MGPPDTPRQSLFIANAVEDCHTPAAGPHAPEVLPMVEEGVRRQPLVGRQRELAFLVDALAADTGAVISLYGPAGIGKSALLTELNTTLAILSRPSLVLDGRTFEPSAAGFLAALGQTLGLTQHDAESVRAAVASLPAGFVLIIDSHDRLWLLDHWLSTEFAALLPRTTALVVAGRTRLGRNWCFDARLAGRLHLLPLGPLMAQDAAALLVRHGVPNADIETLAHMAGGHPLALELIGAVAPLGRSRIKVAADIVHELAELFLDAVDDPVLRRAVEAAACVRRLTTGLLQAMLPDADASELMGRLRPLPLFESGREGLTLHEAVRGAIAAALQATDSERANAYQRAAWRYVRAAGASVDPSARWQCCADMIFLLRNPAVRGAFFPADTQPASAQRAQPRDVQGIVSIVERFDSPAAVAMVASWLERETRAFRVVRGDDDSVDAFYWAFDPFRVDRPLLQRDPVALAWWAHLRDQGADRAGRAVFVRRQLSREHGEGACPAQGVCWLDIKHFYMEMRPTLRWVYTLMQDPEPFRPAMEPLGFRIVDELAVTVAGVRFQTLCLDMGRGSFDTWMAGVVANELGAGMGSLLDAATREMLIDGRRVALTPMEFGVLGLLVAHEGRAVSRATLLDEVWGEHWDGYSNVIEAVIKSLRRKLGTAADRIRTIRGIGYLYRE